MGYHVPVMPDEVAEYLRPRPGMLLLDGTLGGGGHSEQLLAAGAEVVGFDRDPAAVREAGGRLAAYRERFRAYHENFARAAATIAGQGIASIDGAVLDLGVSSHQLETPARGFSFQRNGPLDMRMDATSPLTAADVINSAPIEELVRIFREYGEEPKAARIASRIAQIRVTHPFRTTFDLVAAVESAVRRTGRRNPATRVFQALRIAVNDELGALQTALETITSLLAPDARFVVITFHSLEDRVVKRFFRGHSTPWLDRPEWPEPRPNPACCLRLITPAPVLPSPREIEDNPRARSAKLRVAEKIHPEEIP